MKKLAFILALMLCLVCFTGCASAPAAKPAPQAQTTTDKKDEFYTDEKGRKHFLTADECRRLENTAILLAQQIITFTDAASTEKSVYPRDFTAEDIAAVCISGGGFSGIGAGCGGFEQDEFYPYKDMALHQGPYFAMSRDNCRKIAKQLFGRDDFIIEDDYLKFDIITGHYWDLANRKTPYSVSGAVWADGVVSVDFTVKLRKGDRIKYRTDFVPVMDDESLYLQLKEIHKGSVLVSFTADYYIQTLRPQLEYTILSDSVCGEKSEEMAFSGDCVYYENRGESGELFSFNELVTGAEEYYTNDNIYRKARNMQYLVENANIVYARDAFTPDSTGYENIPRDNVLAVTTYENTVPVQVRYTNYFKSDRKPKQLWIDYFTQVRDKTPGAKDTPVVIYESYEFVIDGIECALVHCTNIVPESVYDGPVLDGPPPGSEFLYYNDFHYFVGNKKEKAEKGFVREGTVDTKPLAECTTSFCGDEFEHYGKMLKPTYSLYCQFYDGQGNVAVYNIYDMIWTGDCSINMCREWDKEVAVIDIDGDGQVEIVEWSYAHSSGPWNAFPAVSNLDTATQTLVVKGLNIEW